MRFVLLYQNCRACILLSDSVPASCASVVTQTEGAILGFGLVCISASLGRWSVFACFCRTLWMSLIL